MAESLESGASMVAAHAALAHAAEGHGAGGQVDDGVVDAPAPEGTAAQNPLLNPLAPGEEIEGQGLFPAVDEVDGLVQAVIGDDGQDGPENLLPHGLGGPVQGIRHQGGGDPSAVRVRTGAPPPPAGPGDGYSACG